MKATVYVDQETSYQLRGGGIALLSSPIFGDKQLSGKIKYISPVADVNHNFQVDLKVENNTGFDLKGGTDVVVSFGTQFNEKGLIIPKTALMTDAAQPYVYTVENKIAKVKNIVTGKFFGDKVEVLAGLTPQQEIICSGQINLHDGSLVNILKK